MISGGELLFTADDGSARKTAGHSRNGPHRLAGSHWLERLYYNAKHLEYNRCSLGSPQRTCHTEENKSKQTKTNTYNVYIITLIFTDFTGFSQCVCDL